MHSDLIDSVSLGMKEDMWWTSETVYEFERMIVNLDSSPEIAGIKGNSWATPCIHIKLKDGSELIKNCYTQDGESIEKPDWFSLGCMSSDYQGYIDSIGNALPIIGED